MSVLIPSLLITIHLLSQLEYAVTASETSNIPAQSSPSLVVGYLGASNDTITSDRVLRLLKGQEFIRTASSSALGGGYGSLLKNSGRHTISLAYKITNKCDVGMATKNLFHLLNTEKNLIVLVVHSCTEVLKVIGELAADLQLLVLGIGSTSAVLKNTDKYETVQLLTEVENTHSAARLAFIQSQGWRSVVTVAEDYEDYTLAAENFYESAENSTKVNVSAAMTLVPTHTDINNKIEDIFTDDWRIIFLFGSQRVLEDVILAMTSKPNFLKARRVIISNQDIPKVPPKLELFYIGSSFSQGIKSSSINEHSIIHSMCRQLQHFISQLPANLVESEKIKQYIAKNFVYRGNFSTSIYQYNQRAKDYKLLVATNLNKTNWTEHLANITWSGGKKPIDSQYEKIVYNEINVKALYVFSALCGVGSLVAVIFLTITLRYRHVR